MHVSKLSAGEQERRKTDLGSQGPASCNSLLTSLLFSYREVRVVPPGDGVAHAARRLR